MMTIDEIVAKRRRSWEKRHDINYDAMMVESAIQYIHSDEGLRREIREKPHKLIEVAFTIVDKKKSTVPFFFNEVQQDFIHRLEHRRTGVPFFVLKGRQQGFTTLITAIQLAYAIVRKNFSGFTVANIQENTDSIFNDKAKAVYTRLPASLKPHEKYNNRKEYYFDTLNSSWRVATASKELGRSKTLEFCHFSEIAFYECAMSDLQKSIGEALTRDAIVVYETTANGYNEAKDLWDSGICENLFYEWWRTAEYAIEDTSVLDDLQDGWIIDRVAWLRAKGITEPQIAWYVTKYNSYLEKDSIKQEYPCYPEEAFIASGDCEFGNELVTSRIEACREKKPINRGYFDYKTRITEEDEIEIYDIEWVEDERGEISIYEAPIIDDKKGKMPYALGGDTAGDGSDFFTAHVINNMTGETVAVYKKQNTADDLYADQIYCLGMYYNIAIVGIEVNFSYQPTNRLHRAGYPHLYVREHIDSLTNRVDKRYGFKTTALTRPVIIAELKRKFRESNGTIVCDIPTLNEMLTFVKNQKGKPEAIVGKHDDLVMSLAITHFIGQQGDHTYTDVPIKRYRFYDEDTEDYAGMTPSEEYMQW